MKIEKQISWKRAKNNTIAKDCTSKNQDQHEDFLLKQNKKLFSEYTKQVDPKNLIYQSTVNLDVNKKIVISGVILKTQ